jgi:hypothetical protein
MSFNIGNETFATKKKAIEKCRSLLHSGGPDNVVIGPKDEALLSALFHARPQKVAELRGRKIVGWTREKNPMNANFAAMLDDGNSLHFSYLKSIKAIWDQSKAEA